MSAEQGVLIESGEARGAPAPAPPPQRRKLRLKGVDRQQIVWRAIDPEHLVEEDHPARAIWDLLGRLDVDSFCAGIEAVEGRPGRDRSDPRVLMALWLYALSRGVREARALDAWAQYEPGCQWLLGLGRINYHTLSDFVTAHAAALDELFVQLVHVLMSEGLADLERVAHDGTKIRAAASRASFKREERLAECRQLAEEHLAALQQQSRRKRVRPAVKRSSARRGNVANGCAGGAGVAAATGEAGGGRASPGAGECYGSGGAQDAAGRWRLRTQLQRADLHRLPAGRDRRLRPQPVRRRQSGIAGGPERIEQNTGQAPKQLLVDGSYTTRQNILESAPGPSELIGSLGEDRSQGKLRSQGVSPEFFPDRFVFDAQKNQYTCPVGKFLVFQNNASWWEQQRSITARASDCQDCPLRTQCCPGKQPRGRLVFRTEEHPQVAAFRAKMQRDEYRQIYRQRAQVAEFSNACLKEKRGLRKFLRRG